MSSSLSRGSVRQYSLRPIATACGAILLAACSSSAPDPTAEEVGADRDATGSPASAPMAASGGPGHRLDDLSGVEIPATVASGSIHEPVEFTVETAKIGNGILEIRQGSGFFPDRSLMVFLFLEPGESPYGRTFSAKPDAGFGVPHVHMNYKVEGEDLPETEMFTGEYAMHLELGNAEDGRVTGAIYLCLPDEAKSFVAGTFEATLD